jgi:hypothetical protein
MTLLSRSPLFLEHDTGVGLVAEHRPTAQELHW